MKLSLRLAFLLALLSLFLMAHHPLSDSEPTVYIVTAPSGARLRACPQTSCPILRTLRNRTPVTVIGMTTGTTVSNNSLWAVVSFDGQIAYIHSSLIRPTTASVYTPVANSQTAPQTFEFTPSPPSEPDHTHADSGHGSSHDSGHDGGHHPSHDDGQHTPDHQDPGSDDDLICEEEQPDFHG
ncbi:MAG: SH3 domain-containing protein [Aggregatilineales bacterium]